MFDFFKVKKVSEEPKKVKEVEDFENIDLISKYFKDETGIDFEDQKTILKSKVASLCRIHHISSFHQCKEELQNNPSFRQEAINYLATNESFFYRELHQISTLVEKVLSSKEEVTILCAPCANGEEPYSIAIALLEAGVSTHRFKIRGIDISSKAINKAHEGLYNAKSIRNLSEILLNRYFTKENELYKINKEIKDQVSFSCVNIFDKAFERIGKFDYIFSRNMLIYFDHDTRHQAHVIFKKQLKNPDEAIFFGHADLPSSSK